MESLLRAQLRLAVITLIPLVAIAIGVPLVFHLAPSLSGVRVGGMPIAFLLLGVLIYPLLVFLGWSYVRRAERHEREFTELVDIAEAPPETP